MKNKISLIGLIALLIFSGCKKEKGPEGIQLDVPFYATPGTEYLLKDYRPDITTGNNIEHTLKFRCDNVEDYRCFLSEGISGCCSNSTGGAAVAHTFINENNLNDSTFRLLVRGCTSGEEWDTTNFYSPKFFYHSYRIHLLKIDPWENMPAKQQDYKVKYVIKRN